MTTADSTAALSAAWAAHLVDNAGSDHDCVPEFCAADILVALSADWCGHEAEIERLTERVRLADAAAASLLGLHRLRIVPEAER